MSVQYRNPNAYRNPDPAQWRTAAHPATPKQETFIQTLVRQRMVPQEWMDQISLDLQAGLSKAHASKWIDWLRNQGIRNVPLTSSHFEPLSVRDGVRDEREAWVDPEDTVRDVEKPEPEKETVNLHPGVYVVRVIAGVGEPVYYRVRNSNRGLKASRLTIKPGEKPRTRPVRSWEEWSLKQYGERVTVSEAGELGLTTGWCVVCGRTLTDPESVEKGIGPVCESRQGSVS